MFPIPFGRNRKKNKYYVQRNSPTGSIMSGDSPSAHATEPFDYIDGRSSPAPTTSKDIGIQSSDVVTASVLVEPPKEKDKDKDDDNVAFCSPVANSSEDGERRQSGTDKTFNLDDDDGDKKYNKDDGDKKKTENSDKVDGSLLIPKGEKMYMEYNNPENDSCCIKCLSFTLQCCECTIM